MAEENEPTTGRREYPVGPGWWPLLDALIVELQGISPTWDPDTLAVKEKYGRCDISTSPASVTDDRDAFFDAISTAEAASEALCEKCGAAGEPDESVSRWILTLCPVHRDERAAAAAADRGRQITQWPPLEGRWTGGWQSLMHDLRKTLSVIDPALVVFRVFSRNGTLRVGFWATPEKRTEVEAAVEAAVELSSHVCERCGAEGESLWEEQQRWRYPVLCDACREFAVAASEAPSAVADPAIGARLFIRDEALIFTETPGGELVPAGVSEEVRVQAVRTADGVFTWIRVDAEIPTGAVVMGEPVKAVVINAVAVEGDAR